ncbi:MAG: hypothetical protein ABFS56_33300 [Pseudomonadota bacterium]
MKVESISIQDFKLFENLKVTFKHQTLEEIGNLCTSADCFGQNVEAPRLEEGDLVVIPNAERGNDKKLK